jgi:UDPglucose 6-dehydrogenase
MKVVVQGLWHLGCVTAGCLAAAGHQVVGLDFDEAVVGRLRDGEPPISEPGLNDLIRAGLDTKSLSFSSDPAVVRGARLTWVAYDTPVDEADRADVGFVTDAVKRLFPYLEENAVVLLSSQLPAGSTRALAEEFRQARPGVTVHFGYSPENLRLGKAIDVFRNPERIVAGIDEAARATITEAVSPVTDAPIIWMSIESAEMTKHALNAFLACSVVFINELAMICERVGADAKEVERGLKSDSRIGQKAYLSPGGPFAGGTLARDVQFLTELAESRDLPAHLFPAIKASNEAHRGWALRRIDSYLRALQGDAAPVVAVWGLTYKPGTDTLRRSSSIELCRAIASRGVRVQAHDPAVKRLPSELSADIVLCTTPEAALEGASILVVATEWPVFRTIPADALRAHMRAPVVIDASRFTAKSFAEQPGVTYISVGVPE